jgi:hypothetical protein
VGQVSSQNEPNKLPREGVKTAPLTVDHSWLAVPGLFLDSV